MKFFLYGGIWLFWIVSKIKNGYEHSSEGIFYMFLGAIITWPLIIYLAFWAINHLKSIIL